MVDEIESRSRTQGTRGFSVSGFPFKQWLEWEQDCKDNFGNCYWLKIWSDHIEAHSDSKVQILLTRIDELEAKIAVLEQAVASKSDEREVQAITFTGKFGSR